MQFQSVSENEKLLLPTPIPGGFHGNEDLPMLAVFWDDADLTLGDGKLLYQVSIAINNAKLNNIKIRFWQLKFSDLGTWVLGASPVK